MKITKIIIIFLLSSNAFSQDVDWEYYGQAVEYQNKEEYVKAIEIYSELLEADTNIYACWYNRGHCFWSLSEYDFALYDLYRAVNLYQGDSALFFDIGLLHINFEDWDKGIEFLTYAIERNHPKDEVYYTNIGSCYFFLGDFDSAVENLTNAYELNPKRSEVITNLAFSYIESDPYKSCFFFEQVYKLDTLDAVAINNLGFSHYLCGRLDDAYEFYMKSYSINPTNSFLHRNLGLYFIRTGEASEACSCLTKALNLGFIKEWGESHISELIEFCKDKN